MNITIKSLTLVSFAGLISIAAYGTPATNDIPAAPNDSTGETSFNNSFYAYGDFYREKQNSSSFGDMNLYGGTVGYIHNFQNQNYIQAEFTYLHGSDTWDQSLYSSLDYTVVLSVDNHRDEYHLETMCGFGEKRIISFGLEYIYLYTYGKEVEKVTFTLNENSYYSEYSGSSSDNLALAKVRIGYPFEIFSKQGQKLAITPSITGGIGCAFRTGDYDYFHWAYESDAKCSVSYSFGRSEIIAEGGYRTFGSFARIGSSASWIDGIFARAGYAFKW